ncbi:hypothetical protein MRB53_025560 [Persea americana]|uniref:Uncharacterized protein n=1 Tax=Persea americana TaxID=3435 RepID=A0ACC2LFL5_PERAE|nr:hypothetical protein MRB53_025560 [Persea americana]
MSNVQTWVSAAITDEYTCLDGLAETAGNGELKAALRSRVVHVARLTSNALALLNRYAGGCIKQQCQCHGSSFLLLFHDFCRERGS